MDIFTKLDAVELPEEEVKSFGPLPEGEYVAEVTSAEVKEELDVTRIELEFTICSGQFKKRKVWSNFKLNNETSLKKLAFVKGQIQKLSGKKTGSTFDNVIGSQGNVVDITVKHNEFNGKTYLNVYVVGQSDARSELDEIPF